MYRHSAEKYRDMIFSPGLVEDLIIISVEGPSLEDFDARECGKLV